MKKTPNVFLIPICLCFTVLISSAGCNRETQKAQVVPEPVSEVAATTTHLATIADDEKPVNSRSSYGHGGGSAGKGATSLFTVVFSERGGGAAYSAEKDGKSYVVHNGKAGNLYQSIGAIVLSPDGKRIAYSAQVDGSWRMVTDGKDGRGFDQINEPAFSPDGRHIVYVARSGEQWHIVVDNTMSQGKKAHYGDPVFSSDSLKIAYIVHTDGDQKTRFVVRDLASKKQSQKEVSGALMVVNKDRTMIATVTESDKKQSMIQISLNQPDAVVEGAQYDAISHLAFGADGASVSYIAERGGKRFVILNGKEERLPDGDPAGPPVVRPDNKGVGIIMASKDGTFLHEAFSRVGGKKERYDEAADLVYGKDSSMHAYAARKGNNWFIVVNGREGPVFDRVVSPLFSPDGTLLAYRARKDGKRFVVVADAAGNVLRHHPAYEQVFPPVFTADGKSVAYGVKDGNKLIWKVEKLLN